MVWNYSHNKQHSRYHGVAYHKPLKRWMVVVQFRHKVQYITSFTKDREEDAARVADVVRVILYGCRQRKDLNFDGFLPPGWSYTRLLNIMYSKGMISRERLARFCILPTYAELIRKEVALERG